MNTTISSNGLPQLALVTTNTDSAPGQPASAGNASGPSAAQSGESVSLKLTDSARALQQTKGTDAPVDASRVAQIKQSLADGTYTVNAGNIASKLTSLESQINGK